MGSTNSHRTRRSRPLSAGILLLFISILSFASSASLRANSILPNNARVRDAVIPFYDEASNKPLCLLRMDKFGGDYQRRGFFRIGVLPTVVAQNVRIEIVDPTLSQQGLQNIGKQLVKWKGNRTVEFRKVLIAFDPDSKRTLQGGEMRIDSAGNLYFSDDITFATSSETNHAKKATLQIQGPQAGKLTLVSGDQTKHFDLFSIPPKTNP